MNYRIINLLSFMKTYRHCNHIYPLRRFGLADTQNRIGLRLERTKTFLREIEFNMRDLTLGRTKPCC